MNKAFFIGNLTKDPEVRATAEGTTVCTFTIAVNRKRSKEKVADYINVVAWRTLGEICGKYLTKGKKCAVCGEIRTSSYDKDGQKFYKTELLADEVEFLTPAGEAKDENKDPFLSRIIELPEDEPLPF